MQKRSDPVVSEGTSEAESSSRSSRRKAKPPDSEVVPPSRKDEMSRVFRLANELDHSHPRPAYLSSNVPYNILPLDPDSENEAIMKIPQIKAAVMLLRNTINHLPWPIHHTPKVNEDILDWLQIIFGFQKDNISNQREHLILLLANVQSRQNPILDDGEQKVVDLSLNIVMNKLLENYHKWCKYLDKPDVTLRLPTRDKREEKLLFIGLYLLIWGEAANLRFMPECLCYIFYHMSKELINIYDGGNEPQAYGGGGDETFLKEVVTPIYKTIKLEATKGKEGKHAKWRNYDDLNEYFWSTECFRSLGWPMKLDSDFFSEDSKEIKGKVNFVEKRSFLQLFRSFDRMWSFYIMSLQAMIIFAWNEHGQSHLEVLSIFITAAILNFLQALVDIYLSWEARHRMTNSEKLRYLLKAIVAAVWVIVMAFTCAHNHKLHSLFILAIFMYVLPSMFSVMLSLCPCIQDSLEMSDCNIMVFLTWWWQPRIYIGRRMYESVWSFCMYTLFWVVLLISKFAFNYYVEIKPLVGPTKDILRLSLSVNRLPISYPYAWGKIGNVVTLWSPIVLVYFMDTQIWYAILSTLVGGLYGAYRHVGEVQTLGMLRSRFKSLPNNFNTVFFQERKRLRNQSYFSNNSYETPISRGMEGKRFGQMWNKIIFSFRQEDIISNRELNLLLFPNWDEPGVDFNRLPLFLLASKIPIAMDMAKDSDKNCQKLKKTLQSDSDMGSAVKECYACLKNILNKLIYVPRDEDYINKIFSIIDGHIERDTLFDELDFSALPNLHGEVVRLAEYLLSYRAEDKDEIENKIDDVVNSILKVLTKDILKGANDELTLRESDRLIFRRLEHTMGTQIEAWEKKIKRFHLFLTESALDVPQNLEARRRLTFFTNSLFMKMPGAPKVFNMLSFSTLTPYYSEDVLWSTFDLEKPNEEGISILNYLKKIYEDEWKNFEERVNNDPEKLEMRLWATYRSQTLTRTVRGMMYNREALELQAFFDLARSERELEKRYKYNMEEGGASKPERSLWAECEAYADMKYTYVVSCQQYSTHKRNNDQRAKDILRLMTTYPSFRVAYVDEVGNAEKIYYSVLVKAAPKTEHEEGLSESVETLEQEIYRIKLPGPTLVGEGKPENQNQAIIFTRGEALQTIDMNQDFYIEEAFKMRNLLQEFTEKHGGVRFPTILGLREHIFTRRVSCLASFMSYQEHSFVTIGQRVIANLLKVRFHYGHPDIFDRLFHFTRGGVSKASKTINLSEDIFAGFNSTLREGNVTHHEYIQVGKGRDVGLNQISLFEEKVANGNGEQTLSRDLYRLAHHFDFFRMLSCYFTTVGFYVSVLLTVLTVYIFLYGRLYLSLTGLEQELRNQPAIHYSKLLQRALASQMFVQFAFLITLPVMMEFFLERGFHNALISFIWMQLKLASVFFTFQLGTKYHYYCKTMSHGGAEYKGTGRGFVVFHSKFAENYRLYSRSHFVKAFELMMLLVVNQIYATTHMGVINVTIWFLVVTWLFAPFLFNPFGFEWRKIVEDWTDWNKWIFKYDNGVIDVLPEKSWEPWWEKELDHLRLSGKWGAFVEIVLALRFFVIQYGLTYHLSSIEQTIKFWIYPASLLLLVIIITIVWGLGVARRQYGEHFQFCFRIINLVVFLILLTILIFLPSRGLITLRDLCLCILMLIPTGWGLLLILQTCKPLCQWIGIWSSVKIVAWSYDILMGSLLFIPIALLAWFPFVSEFQNRILFQQSFTRDLESSRTLARLNGDSQNNSANVPTARKDQ